MIKRSGFIKRYIDKYGWRFPTVFRGIIFAGFFAAAFYTVAVTSNYFPIKLPAALPFLVSDKSSDEVAENPALAADDVVADTPADAEAVAGNPLASSDKLLQLDANIRAAGISIDGIALLGLDGVVHKTRIDFKAEATEEQKSRAHEMVNHFDWTITYKDIFNPQKAKEEIIKQYPPEKLAMVSAHLPVINYFLDHKEFKKLKAFLNSLFLQNTISQDDYMVFANILAGQKIYLNPVFAEAPAENPPAAPAAEPPAQTPAPEPSVEDPVQPQPQAEPAPAEQTPVVEQPPADEPLPAPPAAEPPAESPQN